MTNCFYFINLIRQINFFDTRTNMKYVRQSIVFRNDFTSFHLMQRITYIYLIFSLLCPISILAETAKGVVFLDANENGIKDSHEKGLAKV